MTARTAAERYFAERMLDPVYAEAHEEARARIAFVDGVIASLDQQRRQRDLSKAELARRAGLKPEVVRRLFSRTRVNPTLATFFALANALHIEIRLIPGSDVTRT